MAQKSVLIVDDDPVMLELAGGIMESLGWQVVLASSVAEATTRWGQRLDAFITDIVLPDGSGWTLADLIKARFPRAQVLYATGSPGPAQRMQQNQAGIIHGELIAKPYTVEALRAALGEGTAP